MAETPELGCNENTPLPIAIVPPTMLRGGSSSDEKSEISNVDKETHSPK